MRTRPQIPPETALTAEQRQRRNRRRPWHAPSAGIVMSLPGSGVPPPASAGWPNTSGAVIASPQLYTFWDGGGNGRYWLPTPSGPAFCSKNHTTQQADRYEGPDHPYKHCINTTLEARVKEHALPGSGATPTNSSYHRCARAFDVTPEAKKVRERQKRSLMSRPRQVPI